MIRLDDTCFSYGGSEEPQIKAIDCLSLDICEGEHLCIIGPNGSGKSTLGKLLNALLIPDSGKVVVDGIDTADEARVWDIRQKVGMVFQNPDNQIVATNVEEDVAFGPENLGIPPAEIKGRVNEALSVVRMEEYRDRAPHTLSGGQKQRVAIAGVIAMRPKYLVLDEPTGMLDPQGRTDILSTVQQLKQEGIGIIYVTHFMDETVYSDRVVVVDKGKVVTAGNPRQVFNNVDLLRSVNLDVPQMTTLANTLREKGVPVTGSLLSVDEMVGALWRLLK